MKKILSMLAVILPIFLIGIATLVIWNSLIRMIETLYSADLFGLPNQFHPISYISKSTPIQWLAEKSGAKSIGILIITTIIVIQMLRLGFRFLKKILNNLMEIVKFAWSLIFIYLPRIALWINPWSAFIALMKRYKKFLWMYYDKQDILRIFLTHIDTLFKIIFIRSFPIQWRKYHELTTPYEHRWLLKKCNNGIAVILNSSEHYAMDIMRTPNEIRFAINKWGKTFSELKKKIEDNQKEFTIHLSKEKSHGLFTYEEDGKLNVNIKTRPEWRTCSIEPGEAVNLVKRWELLLGFSIASEEEILPVTISLDKLTMGCIIWAPQVGKDIFVKNMIASLIPQIHSWLNCEITFCDSKECDANYLTGLKYMWIERIGSDENEIITALKKLVQEMKERQAMFWTLGNANSWNKKYPTKKLNTKLIIINEVSDLLVSASQNGKKEIMSLISSLCMKGLGSNFKVIIMSQTLRKDQWYGIGALLSTLSTKIIWKAANDSEARINFGSAYYDEYRDIPRYCFGMFIDWVKAVELFRPYLLPEESISIWLENTYRKDEESTTHNSRPIEYNKECKSVLPITQSNQINLKDLFREAYQLWKLPRSLAMKYWIWEKSFPAFRQKLEGLWIIESKNGVASSIINGLSLEEILEKINTLKDL